MLSALIPATGALPPTHTSSALVLPSFSTAVTASADPDFNRMVVRLASPQNSSVSAVIPVVNRIAEATRNILIRSADERDALIASLLAAQSRLEESDRLHEARQQADAKHINELTAGLAEQKTRSNEQKAEVDTMKENLKQANTALQTAHQTIQTLQTAQQPQTAPQPQAAPQPQKKGHRKYLIAGPRRNK